MTATAPTISAFLSREHKLLIGGEWRAAGADELIPVENPATEEIVAQVRAASAKDVHEAVLAGRAALEGAWGRMSANDRARILFRLADLVEAHAQELADIETIENGMPNALALATTRGFCVDFIRYYAGWCTKIHGDTIPASPFGREGAEWLVYTLREPIGVVGAIIPWNAPSSMIALKLAPALAAGCTLVLKPAELTPLVAIRWAELALEAGLPPGTLNLVQGRGQDVGAALVAHRGLDKISFTGSTAVGKSIVRAAADDLKRVTLELGGKSPFVVFPDADLEQAIPAAAMACFFLTGQNCMAGTRLFLHEAIHDVFVDGLVKVRDMLKVGDGRDPSVMIGPLISGKQKERVLRMMQSGAESGARPVAGGTAIAGPGHFVEPSIYVDVSPHSPLAQEEVFGPVLSVFKFREGAEDELFAQVNGTPYGLSGSVWTRDLATALKAVKRVDSGQVSVNAHAAIAPETPFGGNKQSGWGREFGKEGLEPYLKTKAVTVLLGGGGQLGA